MRAKKLVIVYGIDTDDAQALVDAGLDTPRKIKAATTATVDEVEMPKSARDKVKARK